MVSERIKNRIEAKRKNLRNQLWPGLDTKRLWNRKSFKGFVSIPRTMPLICKILNEMSEKGRLSETYYTLWFRNNDQNFIEISNPRELAFSAGYTGQRGVQAWTTRMRELSRLRFISVKSGASGEFNYILIWEPHTIIFEHETKKTPRLLAISLTALKARLNEIGNPEIKIEPTSEK